MHPTLYFSVLATITEGPWLFILLFGPVPLDNHDASATQAQLWLICSTLIGIGGVGAWLGIDRQEEIAQEWKLLWRAAIRPALVLHTGAHRTARSAGKAHLRVVGGTAVSYERQRA